MVEEQSKTSVDYFNSSSLLFNNQWLLVETRTTKSLIPLKETKSISPSSCLSVQVSSSVVATSPTQMEVTQSVQIEKWIIHTVSIFSPLQADSKKYAQERDASPANISQLNLLSSPQKTKSKNIRNSTHQKSKYPDNLPPHHHLPAGESDSILIKKNSSQKSQSTGNQINLINLQDCNQLSQSKTNQNVNQQDSHKTPNATVIEEEDEEEEKILLTQENNLAHSKCQLFPLENNSNLPQQQSQIVQHPETPIKNEGNVKKNFNPQYFESLLQAGLFSSGNFLDNEKSEGEEEISSNIFSYESDKISPGKVPIVKKAIAKSSRNLSDRFSGANSAIKLPNNVANHHPPLRKSSSSNSLIQFSSSPNLGYYNTNSTCSRKQSTTISSSIGIDSEVNIEFKRDRKNLVKNFVKAFRSFVCSEEDEPEVREALYSSMEQPSNEHILTDLLLERRKELNTLVGDTRNFNNSLMVSIIKSQLLQPLLSYFLTHKAVNWIETSKIKDKQSHLIALRDYQSSMSNPQTLARLRCLKYRSSTNIEQQQQQSQQLLEQPRHTSLFTGIQMV